MTPNCEKTFIVGGGGYGSPGSDLKETSNRLWSGVDCHIHEKIGVWHVGLGRKVLSLKLLRRSTEAVTDL